MRDVMQHNGKKITFHLLEKSVSSQHWPSPDCRKLRNNFVRSSEDHSYELYKEMEEEKKGDSRCKVFDFNVPEKIFSFFFVPFSLTLLIMSCLLLKIIIFPLRRL